MQFILLNKKYTNVESHDWFCTAEYKKYTCYIWYICTHYITHEMESDSWQSDKNPVWNGKTSEKRISLFDHQWKVEHADVIVPLKGRKEILRCVWYKRRILLSRWHNLFFTLASGWYYDVKFITRDTVPFMCQIHYHPRPSLPLYADCESKIFNNCK